MDAKDQKIIDDMMDFASNMENDLDKLYALAGRLSKSYGKLSKLASKLKDQEVKERIMDDLDYANTKIYQAVEYETEISPAHIIDMAID